MYMYTVCMYHCKQLKFSTGQRGSSAMTHPKLLHSSWPGYLKVHIKNMWIPYLDPPRDAKWMVKGAIKQPLRVQTPPLGGSILRSWPAECRFWTLELWLASAQQQEPRCRYVDPHGADFWFSDFRACQGGIPRINWLFKLFQICKDNNNCRENTPGPHTLTKTLSCLTHTQRQITWK